MKAVLIGQPREVCAMDIERVLIYDMGFTAVWNPVRTAIGFGPAVRVLSGLPALFAADLVILLPGWRDCWTSRLEGRLARVLYMMGLILQIVPWNDMMPSRPTDTIPAKTGMISRKALKRSLCPEGMEKQRNYESMRRSLWKKLHMAMGETKVGKVAHDGTYDALRKGGLLGSTEKIQGHKTGGGVLLPGAQGGLREGVPQDRQATIRWTGRRSVDDGDGA